MVDWGGVEVLGGDWGMSRRVESEIGVKSEEEKEEDG